MLTLLASAVLASVSTGAPREGYFLDSYYISSIKPDTVVSVVEVIGNPTEIVNGPSRRDFSEVYNVRVLSGINARPGEEFSVKVSADGTFDSQRGLVGPALRSFELGSRFFLAGTKVAEQPLKALAFYPAFRGTLSHPDNARRSAISANIEALKLVNDGGLETLARKLSPGTWTESLGGQKERLDVKNFLAESLIEAVDSATPKTGQPNRILLKAVAHAYSNSEKVSCKKILEDLATLVATNHKLSAAVFANIYDCIIFPDYEKLARVDQSPLPISASTYGTLISAIPTSLTYAGGISRILTSAPRPPRQNLVQLGELLDATSFLMAQYLLEMWFEDDKVKPALLSEESVEAFYLQDPASWNESEELRRLVREWKVFLNEQP